MSEMFKTGLKKGYKKILARKLKMIKVVLRWYELPRTEKRWRSKYRDEHRSGVLKSINRCQ